MFKKYVSRVESCAKFSYRDFLKNVRIFICWQHYCESADILDSSSREHCCQVADFSATLLKSSGFFSSGRKEFVGGK